MSEKSTLYGILEELTQRYLAERKSAQVSIVTLGNMNIPTHFYPDGEFAVSYEESIRGAHVFCAVHFPNSDNLMELLLMIDAAKRASAKRAS